MALSVCMCREKTHERGRDEQVKQVKGWTHLSPDKQSIILSDILFELGSLGKICTHITRQIGLQEIADNLQLSPARESQWTRRIYWTHARRRLPSYPSWHRFADIYARELKENWTRLATQFSTQLFAQISKLIIVWHDESCQNQRYVDAAKAALLALDSSGLDVRNLINLLWTVLAGLETQVLA